MHELFLTAVVPDADLDRAKALLQGLCGMAAYASMHRVLYFAGPPQPHGLMVKRSIPHPVLPTQARLWTELHQQLLRQSFVVQVRYGVGGDEFGAAPAESAASSSPTTSLIDTPGMLRWVDLPDPTGGSSASGITRLVTQRKTVELPETRNLPTVLTDNNYRFKSELVEESYQYFTNDNEYALVRYHRLPAVRDANGMPVPLAVLPPWEDVVRPPTGQGQGQGQATVDPAGQWLFFVRRHVVEDTSPEKMKSALEALDAARAQLAGAFAFRAVDRRAHDTRIERQANNMPAPLPQKVRA